MQPIDIRNILSLPRDTPTLPEGWLSGLDASILYTISLSIEGATLEVGSWIGKSSCCIAYGVRDRVRQHVDFDIVDFGIAGIAEWTSRFGDSPIAHKEAEKMLKVICSPGGTVALLKQNLVDRDISQFVRGIYLGDIKEYASKQPYEFVFCDATHDAEEIRRNIPIIAKLLAREHFVLVCDDIVTDEHAQLVISLVGADAGWLSNKADQYSKFFVCAKGRYRDLF